MAVMITFSVMVAGMAVGAAPGGPPGNVGNAPDDGSDVSNFTDTSPMDGQQVDPSSLAGKLRVESQYADNVSVELVRNSSSNFTLAITGPEDAENVSFYVQTQAFAGSQNVTNVTATLDGENLSVTRTEAVGQHWVAFNIDHFSTRYVSFETSTPDGGDGRDGGAQGPPALPSASNAPIDADGDGVYEDVNGDGDVTPGDATVLFNAVFERNRAVMDSPAAFDLNGDGSVTPGDATVLFEQAFA